jgi:hypothetical protein
MSDLARLAKLMRGLASLDAPRGRDRKSRTACIQRWRFYAEAACRLRLPAYRPDTANDPLVGWAERHAAFELQRLTGEIDALVDSMRSSAGTAP